jgi:hypothetical protein
MLSSLGVAAHEDWPLFDRFSAPIEKRYDPEEVKGLLEGAGLTDVAVRRCFGWVADGTKPA